jgi:hypothetical protein
MKIKNSYTIERIGDASELLFPDPAMKIAWSEFEKRGIIYYAIQETFIDALHFAQDKLATEELLNHFDDGQYVIKRGNLSFIALMKNDRITFFTIEDDSIVMFYSDMKENTLYWLSSQIERDNAQKNPERIIRGFKNWIITLLNFIKYADVETKFIKAKSKLNVLRKEGKVVNDSNQDYILLNSTWFTNIVRTEGFLVSGHFRLQPYKNGKKLIYIDTYEKHGYNSNAKITNKK